MDKEAIESRQWNKQVVFVTRLVAWGSVALFQKHKPNDRTMKTTEAFFSHSCLLGLLIIHSCQTNAPRAKDSPSRMCVMLVKAAASLI